MAPAKKKSSRIGESIRKRALAYPQTHEDFPWGESAFKVKEKTFVIDESYRSVAPKKLVDALGEPPRLPIPA